MKKYFKDTSNLLTFAIALIPTMIFYFFPPTQSVPFGIFIITVFLLILSIWITMKLYLDYRDISHPTIELINCLDGKCLCLPNPYLSNRSVVSFYKNNSGFEEIICNGYVETITERGMVQIIIIGENPSESFKTIKHNQKDIIIKPTIDINHLSEINKEVSL